MGGRVGAPARGTSHPPWHDGPPRPVFCVRARRRRRGGRAVVLLWLGSWPGHGGAGSQRSGSCRVPGSGSPGRPAGGGASSALAAAEEGEEDRGGARGCASSTHADHPGACVGRHSDHRDMVQLRPGPGHALAVGRPSATPGHFGETDAQAQRYAVAGQDLVPEQGVRDPPGAPGGIRPLLQLDRHADGQGAGVSRVGRSVLTSAAALNLTVVVLESRAWSRWRPPTGLTGRMRDGLIKRGGYWYPVLDEPRDPATGKRRRSGSRAAGPARRRKAPRRG